MALIIRSIIFQLGMWIFTIPFTVSILLCLPFNPINRYRYISLWAKTILKWLKFTCNIDFEVIGIENIPKDPALILSKHQSAWETLAFQKIFPPQVWVLKRELLWVPFFGCGLAMTSPIAINRKAGKKSLNQMLLQGIDRLKKGFWIVIFPEGTRIKPGDIGKFHIGGAWLASQAGVNVVPVAHNAGRFWPKNSLLKLPGVIKVSIGKSISSKGKTAEELNLIVKNWIECEMKVIDV